MSYHQRTYGTPEKPCVGCARANKKTSCQSNKRAPRQEAHQSRGKHLQADGANRGLKENDVVRATKSKLKTNATKNSTRKKRTSRTTKKINRFGEQRHHQNTFREAADWKDERGLLVHASLCFFRGPRWLRKHDEAESTIEKQNLTRNARSDKLSCPLLPTNVDR